MQRLHHRNDDGAAGIEGGLRSRSCLHGRTEPPIEERVGGASENNLANFLGPLAESRDDESVKEWFLRGAVVVAQSDALSRADILDRDFHNEWFSGSRQYVLRDPFLVAGRVLSCGNRIVIVGESRTVVPFAGVTAIFCDHESCVADRVCEVFEWRELYTLGAEPRAAVSEI